MNVSRALQALGHSKMMMRKVRGAIALNLKYTMEYLRAHRKPFPEAENTIAKSAAQSYWYAYYVLKGPFKAGEAAIAKDTADAYAYAVYIKRAPWPEGEAAILTSPLAIYSYMRDIKGDWPEGLKVLEETGRSNEKYLNKWLEYKKSQKDN